MRHRVHTPVRAVIALSAALAATGVLAACSGGSTPSPGAAPSASATTSGGAGSGTGATPSPATPSPATPSPATPSPAATARPATTVTGTGPSAPRPPGTPPTTGAAGTLVLEADGLGVAVGASIRHLPFGTTTRAQVASLLASRLGTARVTTVRECGQGPRTQLSSGSLSALVDGARFVGWTLSPVRAGTQPVGARLTTGDGIGLGSTLAGIRGTRTVTVTTGTLGPEFTAGTLGGLLDGTAPTARVTTLYAGETCFFR